MAIINQLPDLRSPNGGKIPWRDTNSQYFRRRHLAITLLNKHFISWLPSLMARIRPIGSFQQ
jgi:hypothetical protein